MSTIDKLWSQVEYLCNDEKTSLPYPHQLAYEDMVRLMAVQATLEQNELLKNIMLEQVSVKSAIAACSLELHRLMPAIERIATSLEEYVRIEKDLMLEVDDHPSWNASFESEQERQERRDVRMQEESVRSGEFEYYAVPVQEPIYTMSMHMPMEHPWLSKKPEEPERAGGVPEGRWEVSGQTRSGPSMHMPDTYQEALRQGLIHEDDALEDPTHA
jgi:hypothetical protein